MFPYLQHSAWSDKKREHEMMEYPFFLLHPAPSLIFDGTKSVPFDILVIHCICYVKWAIIVRSYCNIMVLCVCAPLSVYKHVLGQVLCQSCCFDNFWLSFVSAGGSRSTTFCIAWANQYFVFIMAYSRSVRINELA